MNDQERRDVIMQQLDLSGRIVPLLEGAHPAIACSTLCELMARVIIVNVDPRGYDEAIDNLGKSLRLYLQALDAEARATRQ